MKRLLALLLALLLPTLACAQTYSAEWMLDVHEEGFKTFAAQVLSAAQLGSDVNAGKVIDAFARILDGFGMRMKWQDNAVAVDVLLNNQSLLDLQVSQLQDQFLMHSSLMPAQHAFLLPAEKQAQLNVAQTMDAETAAARLLAAAMAELAELKSTSYWAATQGDAFGAGSLCQEYLLDDAALATVLEHLMTGENGDALAQLLMLAGMEPKALMDSMLGEIRKIGEKNAYRYVLRFVMDEAGSVIGVTLTALSGDTQVSTLSVGILADSIRIVLGTGRANENSWIDAVVRISEWKTERKLSGTLVQYLAPKNQSYAWVSASNLKPVINEEWEFTMTPTDTGCTWLLAVEAATPEELIALGVDTVQKLMVHGTVVDEPASASVDATFSSGDMQLLSFRASVAPTESLSVPTGELVLVEVNGTDMNQDGLVKTVMDEFSRNIAVRLMKLLPLDVIMSIPNLVNIP